MASSPSPSALIVGASRGLGLAIAQEYVKRGWSVVATVRGAGRTALHDAADRAGGPLGIETVDIVKPDTIEALRQRLTARRFDVLFVNAGISNGPEETIASVSDDDFYRVMATNALGPLRVIEALESLVSPGGVIGVMSSGLGSVANNETGGREVYRASKAALNMLMRSFAARHSGDPRGSSLFRRAGCAQTWAAQTPDLASRTAFPASSTPSPVKPANPISSISTTRATPSVGDRRAFCGP